MAEAPVKRSGDVEDQDLSGSSGLKASLCDAAPGAVGGNGDAMTSAYEFSRKISDRPLHAARGRKVGEGQKENIHGFLRGGSGECAGPGWQF